MNKTKTQNAVSQKLGSPHSAHHNLSPVKRTRRRVFGLIALLVLMTTMLPLSLITGALDIPPAVAWEAIAHFSPTNSDHLLIHNIRIPRTALAIIVASALGVSGLVMQSLTRNPLADPGVLGVNAGAALGVVMSIAYFGVTSSYGFLVAGLLGAGSAGLCVYLLGGVRRGTDPIRLVLAGTALTAVLLAMMRIVIINSSDDVFERFRNWQSGSIVGQDWQSIIPTTVLVILGLGLVATIPRALDMTALGKDLATALGTNTARVWTLSSLAVIILAGSATAIAGPIIFVGLVAPHIARFVAGSTHTWTIPYTIMVSINLTLGADILGRVIAKPDEVSVGIMIAVLGGPFFVALVRKRKLGHL